MAIRVSIVTEPAAFAAARDTWTTLLRDAVGANIFLSHEWLHSWWTAYRPKAALRILVAELEGRTVGIAPLMLLSELQAGVPVRVLRFIGDGSWETDHMSFLVHRDIVAPACDALTDAIEKLDWDLTCLNQMPEHSPVTAAVIAWSRRRSWRHVVGRVPCPRTHLPDDFASLLNTLTPRFRSHLRSSRRKLERQYKVEFGTHSLAEELPHALEMLFRNHASRWRSKGEQGVFGDPDKRRFYHMLAPLFLSRGWLRFFFLKLNDAIVAQEFCFALDGAVMLLQEGFDYSYASDNVGNCLRAWVMEHLIDSGANEYDFLAGSSRHKQTWSNHTSYDLRVNIVRPTIRGRLYSTMAALLSAVRNRSHIETAGGPPA